MPRAGKKNAEAPVTTYPRIDLTLQPPLEAMDAKPAPKLPDGVDWQYEPKWDGFRAIVFHDGTEVVMQSKSGQRLERYFPELAGALSSLPERRFVLDGEIVVDMAGRLDFDALLQRIHPAPSRIARLSKETPAQLRVFDLLESGSHVYSSAPLEQRRDALEKWASANLADSQLIQLSPRSLELRQAQEWLADAARIGCDGVVAKLRQEPYHFGDRKGMLKIKRIRTADCVVGGFRYASAGGKIGSLLLGLYNSSGQLDHVGFTSSFKEADRAAVEEKVKTAMPANGEEGKAGFSGNAPGGPSRWNAYNPRASEWVPLLPKLVVEVSYDHFSGGRFRHGTKIVRWRIDKRPDQCTIDQLGSEAAERR